MVIPLDTDVGYSAFQLWWIALEKSTQPRPLSRRKIEFHLRNRLAAISQQTPFGGRVLKEECSIELAYDERIAIVEAMMGTPWQGEMSPHVTEALELLGAEVWPLTAASLGPGAHPA